ncbi:MAG: OmpA family protein [Alphaproteobacteria bacterium]|nr:OmpA family protein [Alphaproteobacteria bacterium]
MTSRRAIPGGPGVLILALGFALGARAETSAGPPAPPGCVAHKAPPDRDADGVPDGEDACPDHPEDIDGLADGDGCPEADADGDGLVDLGDLCPQEAEDLDGVLDGDGCPDGAATVVFAVTVPSGGTVPEIWLELFPASTQDQVDAPLPKHLHFDAGQPITATLTEGQWSARVRAPGYRDYGMAIQAPGEGELRVLLDLVPNAGVSELRLDVRDTTGRPLDARVMLEGWPQAMEAPRGLLNVQVPAGELRLTLTAPGHFPKDVILAVEAGQVLDQQVALKAMPLAALVMDRIELAEPVTFDPGTDQLTTASFEVLDEVVEVLRQHPEILQIRVEAHTTDGADTQRQLYLSQRQAEAVVRYLVGRGVDASRLYPVGFGGAYLLSEPALRDGVHITQRVELVVEQRR